MTFQQFYRAAMLVNVGVLVVCSLAAFLCGRPREGTIAGLFAVCNTVIFW